MTLGPMVPANGPTMRAAWGQAIYLFYTSFHPVMLDTWYALMLGEPLVHSNIFIQQVLEQQKRRNFTVTIHTLSTPALLVCVCTWTGSYFCFWTNSRVSRLKTNSSDREWPRPSSLQRMFIHLLFPISILPALPTYMPGTLGDLERASEPLKMEFQTVVRLLHLGS